MIWCSAPLLNFTEIRSSLLDMKYRDE